MTELAIILSISCVILLVYGIYKSSITLPYTTIYDSAPIDLKSKGYNVNPYFNVTDGFIGIDRHGEIVVLIKENNVLYVPFKDIYECELVFTNEKMSAKIGLKSIDSPSFIICFFDKKVDESKYFEKLTNECHRCVDTIKAVVLING